MPGDDLSSRGAPWGWQPSLESMCREVHVNFDQFIIGLRNNRSDIELAGELDASPETIKALRNHFEKYGVDSMMGQD